MRKIVVLISLILLSCGLTWAQRLPEFEKAREIKLLEMNRADVSKVNLFSKDINKFFHDTRPPNVTNLILGSPKVTANCDSVSSVCFNGAKTIGIFAIAADPDGDVISFSFKVSGGKIIDKGKTEEYGRRKFHRGKKILWSSLFYYGRKVVWDLSDAKPGTYTITAAVDEGCGFCGKSMTKTIVVKECADCPKN